MTWMKQTLRAGAAALTAAALSLSVVPNASAAIKFGGRIKSGDPGFVLIDFDKAIDGSLPVLKMKFQTTYPGNYKFKFCIGPEANPCGASTYELVLPALSERFAVISPRHFQSEVLFVTLEGSGTIDPVSFSVEIE